MSALPSSETIQGSTWAQKQRPTTEKKRREFETLEHSVLNEMSPSNPSPQTLGNPVEEELEDYKSQWGWRTQRRQASLSKNKVEY